MTKKALFLIVIVTLAVSYRIAWNNVRTPYQRLEKAYQLMNDDRFSESLIMFNKVLKARPRIHMAWSGKAICLLRLGRYDEAIASYDKSLALKPDYELSLLGKGLSLEQLDRVDEAMACYEAMLTIHPGDIRAKRQIEKLRQKTGFIPAPEVIIAPKKQ